MFLVNFSVILFIRVSSPNLEINSKLIVNCHTVIIVNQRLKNSLGTFQEFPSSISRSF